MKNNDCLKCNVDCLTCSGSSDHCTSCYPDSNLNSTKYTCDCLSGTYRDNSDPLKCKVCDKSCAECNNSGDHSCS